MFVVMFVVIYIFLYPVAGKKIFAVVVDDADCSSCSSV
jgi:hypothetical protein